MKIFIPFACLANTVLARLNRCMLEFDESIADRCELNRIETLCRCIWIEKCSQWDFHNRSQQKILEKEMLDCSRNPSSVVPKYLDRLDCNIPNPCQY